jgi:hypothetical protein
MAGLALAVDILAKDHASGTLKKIGDESQKTHSKLAAFAGGLAGGAIGRALTGFFKGGLEGIKSQQAVSAQTAQVIKTMGNAAGVSQAHVEGLADKIEKMSGLEAENIQAGQNMLLTFDKIKGANFDRATNAMADMAARMGGDAVGAATMLGKALNDPVKGISALTRVGVSFSKEQQDQIKHMAKAGDVAGAQTVILKSLEAQFGGSAKAAGQTMGGQMQILQARLGDVEESIVTKLLPALIKLGQGLAGVLSFVQKNSKWLTPLALVVGAVVAATIAWNKAMEIGTAVKTAYIALTGGQAAATEAAAGAQEGLNVAMTANPIGIVVVALAGLVVGLVYAYKHSETFRRVVQGAFHGIADAAKAMWGAIRPVLKFVVDAYLGFFGAILHGAAKAFGWVPGIGPKLKTAAREFDGFKTAVNKSLDGITEHKRITVDVVSVSGGRSSDALLNAHGTYRPTAARATHVNVILDGKVVARSTTTHQTRAVARGALPPGVM